MITSRLTQCTQRHSYKLLYMHVYSIIKHRKSIYTKNVYRYFFHKIIHSHVYNAINFGAYFRYKKCDIIHEYIRYASTYNKYHNIIIMINVLYSSLDVCFCLMLPQTTYEYDLLLLRHNDSFFIYPFILHY